MSDPCASAPAAASAAPTEPNAPPRARVLVLAGEASGDMYGADFVAALRALTGPIDVVGIGGPNLRRAGMRAIADTSELGTVGLLEAVRSARAVVRAYRRVRQVLERERPALCVCIDFPDFNLRVARRARRAGVPVLYYIGPQVWAWRRGRARTVAALADRLALVFPFEADLYRPWSSQVHFVGHPLIDRVRVGADRNTTLASVGLDPARRTVLLLPGSRTTEIAYMLPPFLDAARVLAAADPALQFVIGRADSIDEALLRRHVERAGLRVPIVGERTYDLMGAADVALVTSGTATVECALLDCPMVIAYRLSPVTVALGRLVVRGVRYIGMPNIIAGRAVVPELLQGEVTPWNLAAAARALLDDRARRQAALDGLQVVRDGLGAGGAAERAARLGADLLARPRGGGG